MKKKTKRIIKIIINILFIIIALWAAFRLFMGVALLTNGSFEEFPTEEQESKAFIAGLMFTVQGGFAELLSLIVLFINNRNRRF